MLPKIETPFEKKLLEGVYPILGSLVLLSCRIFLEKYLFGPIAAWHGFPDSKRKKENFDPILEEAYRKSKRWTRDEILGLSKQADLDEGEIKKWLRSRSRENRALRKFYDCAWRFVYFSFDCACAFIVLWDKPWFYDVKQCWSDLENQTITDDVWWYYTLGVSGGWLLLICLFYDVKRKDFLLMFVHHIAQIMVMYFAFVNNLHRIGVLSMFVSNIADVFVEGAKVAKYLEYQTTTYVTFVLFVVSWVIGRLVLHPFWLMRSILMDTSLVFTYRMYMFAVVMCCLFMTLNIIWTYFVFRVVVNYIKTGKQEDARSDSDD